MELQHNDQQAFTSPREVLHALDNVLGDLSDQSRAAYDEFLKREIIQAECRTFFLLDQQGGFPKEHKHLLEELRKFTA